jgi:hypothetical protein
MENMARQPSAPSWPTCAGPYRSRARRRARSRALIAGGRKRVAFAENQGTDNEHH